MTQRFRFATPLIAAALAGCAAAGAAPATPATNRWQPVAAAVEESMRTTGFPAASIAVAVDGQIVYRAAFGRSDIENATPALPATAFRIASLSKPITATAVLQLVQSGRIDLGASIRRYVPALPAAYEPMTVRDLLRHTGGVRHYTNNAEYITTRHCDRLADALPIFARDPLDHAPGEKITYSTWGYALLGMAVEQASGLSFPDYIRRHILEPAAMSSTRVDTPDIIPNRAAGYTSVEGGGLRNADLLDTSCRIPAGGFVSTAEDMARFAIALQNDVLLGAAMRGEMMRSQVTPEIIERTVRGVELPPGYVMPGMSYGWATGRWRDFRTVWHGGNQPGATAILYMIPDRRLSVAILTNLDSKGAQIVALAEAVAAQAPID